MKNWILSGVLFCSCGLPFGIMIYLQETHPQLAQNHAITAALLAVLFFLLGCAEYFYRKCLDENGELDAPWFLKGGHHRMPKPKTLYICSGILLLISIVLLCTNAFAAI
ncbi:MAG: hypothetical protein IJC61_03875 [Oscillospiraceae bacterium]|nr:hypothetical protein [Oscillospiraceae bacterium]MBQ9959946.1 hypothetical protein [Oscillospiraceae bacterium]